MAKNSKVANAKIAKNQKQIIPKKNSNLGKKIKMSNSKMARAQKQFTPTAEN